MALEGRAGEAKRSSPLLKGASAVPYTADLVPPPSDDWRVSALTWMGRMGVGVGVGVGGGKLIVGQTSTRRKGMLFRVSRLYMPKKVYPISRGHTFLVIVGLVISVYRDPTFIDA